MFAFISSTLTNRFVRYCSIHSRWSSGEDLNEWSSGTDVVCCSYTQTRHFGDEDGIREVDTCVNSSSKTNDH